MDIHVPKLEEHEEADAVAAASTAPLAPAHPPRRASPLKIVLEVAMLAAGVFLGLAGEQWREHARRRELAQTSLRRFRSEIAAARTSVAAVKDYHAALFKSLNEYFAADAQSRRNIPVNIHGLQPASFEHTAWDVALATQSLVDLDPDLVFGLSRLYNAEQVYAGLTLGIVQAMYLRPPSENDESFLRSTLVYYGDITLMEPRIVEMCDQLLPQIDRQLGR